MLASRIGKLGFLQNCLSVLILVRIKILTCILILTAAAVVAERTRRAKTLAIALAGINRFEFRLLSGRNEMRVFL